MEIEGSIKGFLNADAIKGSEVVIVCLPAKHSLPTLKDLKGNPTTEKIVISTVVPMTRKKKLFYWTPLDEGEHQALLGRKEDQRLMARTQSVRGASPKIDCHTHLFPGNYLKELKRMNIPLGQTIDDRFTTLEKRLSNMDEAGIHRQVISLAMPGVDMATPEKAVQLSRVVNDELASISAADDRFIGLASLPMLSPLDAADELERAVEDLGLRGAGIFTNVQGKPIDLKEFWPVYERASGLGVPLFIHPIAPVNAEIYQDYHLLTILGFPF